PAPPRDYNPSLHDALPIYGAGKLKVTGDLTIRGVTKEVVLDAEGPTAPIKDPWGNTRSAVSATTHVNRQDFGVKWNANLDGGGVDRKSTRLNSSHRTISYA